MKWHVEGIIEWAVELEADTEAEARTKFAKYSMAELAEKFGKLEENIFESEVERQEHAQSIKEAWDRLRDRGP